MKYAVDFDINTFKFWFRALDVIKRVKEKDLLEDAMICIEAAFEGKTSTDIQINDYVWFHLEDDLWEMQQKALWPGNN